MSPLGRSFEKEAQSPPGYVIPLSPGGTSGSSPPALPPNVGIDLRPGGWPIRNQGRRKTCVAFAVTAAREQLGMTSGRYANLDLSEQFLYWATKTHGGDPHPTVDGTGLEYCCNALARLGVCRKARWPYDPVPRPGDVTHATGGTPTNRARQEALSWSCNHSSYCRGAGNAHAVWSALQANRVAAISLPVARDPTGTNPDNWNLPVARVYGEVIDPPPGSVLLGQGHAVCVTGFVPDGGEPTGGYFIIRNSWGTSWATTPSSSPLTCKAPEPGYGFVSATYVEQHLWEFCIL